MVRMFVNFWKGEGPRGIGDNGRETTEREEVRGRIGVNV